MTGRALNALRRIRNRIIAPSIWQYVDIEGFLTRHEAIALYKIAKVLPTRSTVVEIGSWKGKSTYCLAKGLSEFSKLYAIDPFDATGDEESKSIYESLRGESLLNQFINNMKRYGVVDKVKVCQGYSKDFVGKFESIDLLFIDGDHSIDACSFDYRNYSPFVKRGGYLLIHDFYRSRVNLGPTWVIQNLVTPSGDYIYQGLYDSLWVARRS